MAGTVRVLTPEEVPEQYRTGASSTPPAPMAPNAMERTAAGREIMNIVRGGKAVATGAANWVGDAWSGDKQRTAQLPELTPQAVMRGGDGWSDTTINGLVSFMANASANDPLGYANIMSKTLPGSKITFDKNNNPIIEWRGQQYYANDPGMSGNDVLRLASDTVAYLPAMRWASAAKTAVGGYGKGAIGSGLTNLLQQLAAQQMGSGQDVSFGNIGVAGMAGAAGEGLARFLTPLAVNTYSKLGGGQILSRNGAPTPFAREWITRATGIDPDTISLTTWQALDRFYRRLDEGAQSAVRSGLDVAGAAGTAATEQARAAVMGPVNAAMQVGEQGVLPKTLGQATRNQTQLDFEEMARTGRFSQGARDTMQDFDRLQRDAFTGQVDTLMQMAGGGKSRGATQEAVGQVIKEQVQAAEQRASEGVRAAYSAVPDARLEADPLLSLPNRLSATLRSMDIYPDRAGFEAVYPRTNYALNSIRETMMEKAALPPSKRSFGLMELEQFRKSINKYISREANTPDDVALIAIKKKMDEAVEGVWNAALLKGDTAALQQLKLARQARTEYARMFEPDQVEATVRNTLNKMVSQPDIDNHAVVNWVIGSSEAGFSNAALQMTRQLKKILGSDSEGWNALREAAMQRIIYGVSPSAVRDAMENTDKVVSKSSKQLLNRLDNFLDLGGNGVTKELFTKAELDQLRRFRYELRQIQPGENAQTLRTGASMAQWFNRVGAWIGGGIGAKLGMPGIGAAGGQAVSQAAEGWSKAAQAAAAAGGWQPPRIRSYPVFSSLATGAGLGTYGANPGSGGDQPTPQGQMRLQQ